MDEEYVVTRREFLKTAALAAPALTAALELAGSVRAAYAEEKVLCGLIGCGAHGQELLSILPRVPGLEVAALCDVYQPNLKKAAEIAGQDIATYEDHRAMIEAEKGLRAVIVAAPTGLHAKISADALQAGLNVLCEAPMTHTIEDGKQLRKAAADSKRVFQVGHQRRYSDLYHHARNFVKTGLIGDLKQFRAQRHRKQSWKRAVPDDKYEKALNWRLYHELSGGLMLEFGAHQLDVANWFFNALPESVFGFGGIDEWKDGREVYDNVEVIFAYPGGAKAVYTANLFSSFQSDYEVLLGNKGSMFVSREKGGLLFKEADAATMAWESLAHKGTLGEDEGIALDAHATKFEDALKALPFGKDNAKTSLYKELVDFATCIRENKEPKCGALLGLQAVALGVLANEAIQKGQRVPFPKDLGEG